MLVRLRESPDEREVIGGLQRDLHTLKGGARMVEIAAIGDLAHELEFLYELLAAGRLPPTAVWLESSLSTRRFIVAMIIS